MGWTERLRRACPRPVRAICWGPHLAPPDHRLIRWLFLRALGLLFFVAFVSFWSQAHGLIGSSGLLPAQDYMDHIAPRIGENRFLKMPTIGWYDASDTAITVYCAIGMAASLFIIAGLLTPLAIAVAWFFYLSIIHLGQSFMSFQWDILLVETAVVAFFFAPWTLLETPDTKRPAPLIPLWLLRFLTFRLMFSSGVVKLGDTTWTNLDATKYHYETQPLPTAPGWLAHQMPGWFHEWEVVGLFFIELVVPFAVFAPRRIRHAGALLMILLQIFIAVTGNYTFFNILTIALCLTLFDDHAIRAVIPKGTHLLPARRRTPKTQHALHAGAAVVLVTLGVIYLARLFMPLQAMPESATQALRYTRPFLLVNSYGLFANMTTERNEIVLQGSQDGKTWKTYHFKWKPADPEKRPTLVAPHQPRLDWQMWFAALGSPNRNPWLLRLMHRMLTGLPPEVAQLLETNPFPQTPPKYVRAQFYQYHFSTWKELNEDGLWWTREKKQDYIPPIRLTPNGQSLQVVR